MKSKELSLSGEDEPKIQQLEALRHVLEYQGKPRGWADTSHQDYDPNED